MGDFGEEGIESEDFQLVSMIHFVMEGIGEVGQEWMKKYGGILEEGVMGVALALEKGWLEV